MRLTTVAVAATLALLAAEPAADAKMSRKACRTSCQSAISSCVSHGGRRAACKRQLVQRCRRQGPVACTESLDATTTTTTFSYSYPTTTVPGVGIDVTVHDVRTDFEVDVYVPAAGAQYVLVDVTIENESGYGFTPFGFQLEADGLAFAQMYIADGKYPSCSTNGVMILPGGSLTCTLTFEIPEGTPAGRLAFGTPYGYGSTPSATVTDQFPIPAAVRPSATLDILGTGAGDGYCSIRPGFKGLQVTFAYTSHDGASGLNLNMYQFVLEAAGAIYTPYYCSYPVDPCDASIGVPVDGSASCSLSFQVPASVTEATLRAVSTRYPASTTLALD